MKNKSIYGILGVVFVAILAYFVLANPLTVQDTTINAPTNGTNITGVISLNATLSTTTLNVTNITFSWGNTTNAFVYNVTIFNQTVNDSDFANTSFDTSLLVDGTYNLTVNTTNVTGQSYKNISLRGIVVDNTVPVSIINGSYGNDNISGQNFTITSNVKTFNVTVTDALSGVATVIFGFNNASSTNFNLSASNHSGEWNATYNISKLAEGSHTVTVYVTDYVGLVNSTSTYTFTHDNTVPTISVDCLPQSVETGQSVTCTCTASDGVSGLSSYSFPDSTTEQSVTTSSSGTGTSSVCTATDYAGNSATATGTWTVSDPSGSGGSGGSSGGVSSSVSGTFSKEIWHSINAGETGIVEVENGEIGVTEVNFKVGKTVYGAWLKVEKRTSLPTFVEAFENKVYRNIKISEGNINKVLDGEATIEFKVLNSWLTENGVGKDNIALFHYDQSSKKWKELTTQVGSADDNYQHYSAETPGFSYFVIGETETVTVTPTTEPVVEETVTEEVTEEVEEVTEEVEEVTEETPTWPWVVLILVVIAGIIVAYWLMSRR